MRIHARPYLEHDGAAALGRQGSWLHVRDTLAVADRVRDLDLPARVGVGICRPVSENSRLGLVTAAPEIAYGDRFAWDLGTELRRIEGGEHFVPEDHPDEVLGAT